LGGSIGVVSGQVGQAMGGTTGSMLERSA